MSIFSRLMRRKPAPRKQATRNYSGSITAPRYADFNASERSADAELVSSLVVLRGRSRNLARNNPHARRYMQLMQDNIVGENGFRLQVNALNEANGGVDTAGNRRIEEAWRMWAKNVTTDGKMTFREASELVVRTWCRDGEVFIQKIRNSRYRDRFSLYFIEADRIDVTLNQKNASTGNQIRMGVEVDSHGTPVAYHALTYHPGDTDWTAIPSNRKYVRIPAAEIIHIYEKSRPGQTRGEPPMCGIMTDAKMLAGYREAEITNRRLSAAKMGFFKRIMPGAGPVAGIADSEDPDTGALEMDIEPGKMSVLPEGYEFDKFDSSGSTTDYADFEKQIIRSMAAGLNVSYYSLAMDLSDASFSSMRQGALSERDFYRGMQVFFIEEFAVKVYSEWLASSLEFGDVGIPLFRYDKFLNAAYFRPRGWKWVDPSKDVKAAIDAYENNMTSLTHVVGEQGRELNEVVDEIVAERKLLDAAGLTPQEVVAPNDKP